MKYLYPYECEKLKLSNPAELQAAIDGNRREGRRPSYGYDLSPAPTLLPPQPHPHLNGSLMNGRPSPGMYPIVEYCIKVKSYHPVVMKYILANKISVN